MELIITTRLCDESSPLHVHTLGWEGECVCVGPLETSTQVSTLGRPTPPVLSLSLSLWACVSVWLLLLLLSLSISLSLTLPLCLSLWPIFSVFTDPAWTEADRAPLSLSLSLSLSRSSIICVCVKCVRITEGKQPGQTYLFLRTLLPHHPRRWRRRRRRWKGRTRS